PNDHTKRVIVGGIITFYFPHSQCIGIGDVERLIWYDHRHCTPLTVLDMISSSAKELIPTHWQVMNIMAQWIGENLIGLNRCLRQSASRRFCVGCSSNMGSYAGLRQPDGMGTDIPESSGGSCNNQQNKNSHNDH